MLGTERRAGPWLLVCLAGLLAQTACLVPPRSVLVTASGEVRAPNAILARKAARHVDWTRAELKRRLPGLRDTRTDVWVQEHAYAGPLVWMRVGKLHAFTLESAELGNPRIHVPVETYRTSISHELVHALLGPDWDPLPAMVEEGLCDVMSVELADDPQLHLNLLVSATIGPRLARRAHKMAARVELQQMLRAKHSLDLHDHGSDFTAYAYGLGYVLVDRIRDRHGLGWLYDMCLRARDEGYELLPADWVIEAAEVGDSEQLKADLSEEIDRALFRHLLDSGELMRLIEKLGPPPAGQPWSLDSILITYEADVLGDRGIQRRLVDLPGFRDWARENRGLLERLEVD